jgi:predicted membrane-bound spermidine synthase
MSNRFLYFTVFSTGMTTLAVELSASRLLGAVFGTSNLVWASVIGLILLFLTLGYFVGGRWADRRPEFALFYQIILWGAFLSGLVPLIAKPVLSAAANAFDDLDIGLLLGAFTSVLVLFIIPITLLGMVSPFAIRLAVKKTEEAGEVSGRIYALSTFGSFIGTFLPVLLVIPLFGTTRTFLIFSFYLMTIALFALIRMRGLRSSAKWLLLPIGLGIAAWLWSSAAIKSSTGQIFETESAYNYIQVLESGNTRYLRLNEGQGVHSIYSPDQLDYAGPWSQFLVAPFFNEPPFKMDQVESIAIIGLAAGTSAFQATEVFGSIPIDGYEIDPQIISVGQEFFGMTMPNLNPIAEDGRWGLRNSEARYSLIEIDAYRPPYIPWHLTTLEFFQLTKDRLTVNGALAINVGRAPEDRALINTLVATLREVYASVHVMDVPNTFNSIVYATIQTTSFVNLTQNLDLLNQSEAHPLLITAIERTISNQQPINYGAPVLTDDLAPIESIVNAMVLNFVFAGNLEDLQ